MYLTFPRVRHPRALGLALVGVHRGLVPAAHWSEHHPTPGLTPLAAPLVHTPNLNTIQSLQTPVSLTISDLFSRANCVAVVVGDALHAVGEVEGAPGAGGELGLDAAGAGGGDHAEAEGGGGQGEQGQQQTPGHCEETAETRNMQPWNSFRGTWCHISLRINIAIVFATFNEMLPVLCPEPY